jgi:hypothetical protein
MLSRRILGCLREIVLDRLADIGMKTIRLPLGVEESRPHVPILVSGELQKKNRVLLVFGSTNEDLGVWCYRRLGSNGSSISVSTISIDYFICGAGCDSNLLRPALPLTLLNGFAAITRLKLKLPE